MLNNWKKIGGGVYIVIGWGRLKVDPRHDFNHVFFTKSFSGRSESTTEELFTMEIRFLTHHLVKRQGHISCDRSTACRFSVALIWWKLAMKITGGRSPNSWQYIQKTPRIIMPGYHKSIYIYIYILYVNSHCLLGGYMTHRPHLFQDTMSSSQEVHRKIYN